MTYSAADRVYDEVKELILSCEIPGGELISEGEIAERFAVSRTPVREAFLRLSTEGWMRLYPKRGALVVPVGDREGRDVLDARILVEAHAVRSIVQRPRDLDALAAKLDENLDRHRAVDPADDAAFARVDAEFHQLIVAAGGNALLDGFYTSLGERQRRMTTASVHRDTGVVDRILTDHAALAQAVAAADAEAFASLLAAHLSEVHDLPGSNR